jgi:hypothetical protein
MQMPTSTSPKALTLRNVAEHDLRGVWAWGEKLDERYKDSYSCYYHYVDIVLLEACISSLFGCGTRQLVVVAFVYCTYRKATSFYFIIWIMLV